MLQGIPTEFFSGVSSLVLYCDFFSRKTPPTRVQWAEKQSGEVGWGGWGGW